MFKSSALSVDDDRKPARISTGEFPVAPPVSYGHAVPHNFSVIKSCSEAATRSSSAVHTESCIIPQTVSVGRQCSASSLSSCVQSLCSSAAVISSPPSAAIPSSRPSAANKQPVAMNWNIRKSPVSALDALRMSQSSAVEPFSDQNPSTFPTVGHFLHSKNNRHRSVKAGSTWFPTELQTSLDCGTTKKRNVERSSSARPCISSGAGTLNSPLKKFVDTHPTRNSVSQNLSHSSEGVGFSHNGISTPYAAESIANQPMDLSVQRRKFEPKSEHNPNPNRTHFDVAVSDEPLDLSQSSSSTTMHSDRRTPTRPNHLGRPVDSEIKMPSEMINLQNYCSRLLSGGYSLDSPLSTISSASSFSSLVSKAYFAY